jgi:hypothetical protein
LCCQLRSLIRCLFFADGFVFGKCLFRDLFKDAEVKLVFVVLSLYAFLSISIRINVAHLDTKVIAFVGARHCTAIETAMPTNG